MPELTRDSAFELIRSNIDRHGHHIYVVSGGDAVPRFAYTIGLSARCGVELVLAGASFFAVASVQHIINRIASEFAARVEPAGATYPIESAGTFSLRKVDPSWSSALLLGALDFYGASSIQALQIVPDEDHWTIDVPDLSRPWSAEAEPVWQWLRLPWAYPVPAHSQATTNLAALRGERITEAARWEETVWELFAGPGPDVAEDEVRVVPLGTLLAADPTLVPVAGLDVGQALWRDDADGAWQPWSSAS